ncbi:uncharacterized protein TNCV_2908581 [Trichonephila clavipes]|nr:uncharacterized protein TNCV_2908581 [Trichonephila clavipes]
MRPPQVRKPPYMMSSIPCATGENSYSKRPSPKNTLCGDLNKGFIPMNPLGQEFDGQPYPFDLIKNKTLLFLSKSLPYLKQDPKIPKVSKISGKKSAPAQTNSNSHEYHWHTSAPYRIKRSANESTNATANDIPDILDNETTARQNCDQGGASGLLCSLSSAMSNNKIPLALISAVAQSLASSMSSSTPAPQEYTTESPAPHYSHSQDSANIGGGSSGGGSMAETIIGLLGTLANMGLGEKGPGAVKDSSPNCSSSLISYIIISSSKAIFVGVRGVILISISDLAWHVEGMVLEVSKTGLLVSSGKGENIDPVDEERVLLVMDDATEVHIDY